jgi:hypothetical protein
VSRLDVSPLAEYDPSGGRVKITAPFGDGRNHKGVDWGTTDGIEVGTTLYAPVDGVLENTGHDGNYSSSGGHTAGLWLWWRGDNGTRWKMFHTHAITVPVGSWHPAGAPIAEVGNSGTQAAHLHLEEHAGGWSSPVDFTNDAYEVIEAGRWPGSAPPPEEDDMTDDDHNRILANVGALLDQRIKQFASPNLMWQDGDDYFEVLTDGDGQRVRRTLQSGELVALRAGSTIAEEPVVDVRAMSPAQQDAVRAWREV